MTATETAPETETSTALVLIQQKDAPQYFVANGLDPIIEKIRAEVTGIVPDISTPKGRKEIASLAYKVAQSKTAVDEMGKNLTEEWKTKSKAVDAERKRWREAMDALKEEVRAPLTEWENADKARIAAHEAALIDLDALAANLDGLTAAELEARIAQAKEVFQHRDWQEFGQRAQSSHDQVEDKLQKKLEARRQYEAEQAELARLRREEAERQQRERDERLKAEAAEQARKDAEEKARKEAEEEAARVKAEQERQEQERLRIQQEAEAAAAREEAAKREAAEAEARAKKAEEERKAAEEKAEADRIAAAEQAERDRKEAEEAAAQRERDRIAAEQRQREEETARREADKAHRAKIDNEAMKALLTVLASDNLLTAAAAANAVVAAIAKGQIPHVKISY